MLRDPFPLDSHLTPEFIIYRGRITDLTICENSHSVASASDSGSIHVFRIEYTKKEGNNHRYTGVTTVKYFDKTDCAVVCIDHFNSNSQVPYSPPHIFSRISFFFPFKIFMIVNIGIWYNTGCDMRMGPERAEGSIHDAKSCSTWTPALVHSWQRSQLASNCHLSRVFHVLGSSLQHPYQVLEASSEGYGLSHASLQLCKERILDIFCSWYEDAIHHIFISAPLVLTFFDIN